MNLENFSMIRKNIKIIIGIVSILGLILAGSKLISDMNKNNPKVAFETWKEQYLKLYPEDSQVTDFTFMSAIADYMKKSGKEIIEFSVDLSIDELTSVLGDLGAPAAELIKVELKNQLKSVSTVEVKYSCFNDKGELLDKIDLDVGSELNIIYFANANRVDFKLPTTGQIIRSIDSDKIQYFAMAYIDDPQIAYLTVNGLIGKEKGKTFLNIYHNGELNRISVYVK